jgi:hypothetical protein
VLVQYLAYWGLRATAAPSVFEDSKTEDEEKDKEEQQDGDGAAAGENPLDTAAARKAAVDAAIADEADAHEMADARGGGGGELAADVGAEGAPEDAENSDDKKTPHFVEFTEVAREPFDKRCGVAAKLLLPSGWWIAQRVYTRRVGAVFNSFKARGTAWAPLLVRLYALGIAILSSVTFNDCTIPLFVGGGVSLLLGFVILLLRPMRRPLENVWQPLQMCLAGTLAFTRTNEEEASANIFYAVIGISFGYVVNSIIYEVLEMMLMHAAEKEMRERREQRDLGDAKDAAPVAVAGQQAAAAAVAATDADDVTVDHFDQ